MNWERKHTGRLIKRQIHIQIPILIWLKLLQSIIKSILLYGSEVWGPQTNLKFGQWEKHPIKNAHTGFCKSILQVHGTTANNACRAESGQFPLLLNIQSIKYWLHLKQSALQSYHHQGPALPRGEQRKEWPHSAGPDAMVPDQFNQCPASRPVWDQNDQS